MINIVTGKTITNKAYREAKVSNFPYWIGIVDDDDNDKIVHYARYSKALGMNLLITFPTDDRKYFTWSLAICNETGFNLTASTNEDKFGTLEQALVHLTLHILNITYKDLM